MIGFFSSSEVWTEASTASEPVRRWVHEIMERGLKDIDAEGASALICFIPSLFPEGQERPLRLRYYSKDNSIDFRPSFNYSGFMEANEAGRRLIAAESLLALKARTEKLGLPPMARVRLHELIDDLVTHARRTTPE